MANKLVKGMMLVALIASLSATSVAQGAEASVKGNIAGVVNDPTGAVIQGAKVELVGPTGNRTATTDAEGRFLFQVLIPGMYSVKISREGFKTSEANSVEVQIGRTSTLTVKMELGTSATTVEVSAASIAVDTTSTAGASNLTDQFYESVPVARNITGLFYAAPGVASGGGTGTANPSIAGGTGLENSYVADGVNITDGGFGGIGVYSRNMGSLSTGINLSFVKEVQVKTSGFEAQYGKSTGGIVQFVTKSGSNSFHGQVAAFLAPQQFESTRSFVDDFGAGGSQERFNLQGKILHESQYDVDGEIGGYIPGLKNHLFFFGSFNPQWNKDYDQFAQFRNPSDLGTAGLAGATQTKLGNFTVPVRVYSYAGKLTWRLNDHHQFEGSIFGDPSYGDTTANGNNGPQTASNTTFDKLQYGTRNIAVRYNGTFTPTWLLNASFSWGHNNLSDKPLFPNTYVVVDRIQRNPCGPPVFSPECLSATTELRGQYIRQGIGYYDNTNGNNYGGNFDTTKTARFLGEHNFTVGYRYDRGTYDGTKARTGPILPITAADVANGAGAGLSAADQAIMIQNGTNVSFQLRDAGLGTLLPSGQYANCTTYIGVRYAFLFVPGMTECPNGGIPVYLRQDRGEFGVLKFNTGSYAHNVFAQDTWSMNKYVTISAGIRWEQQQVKGTTTSYTFNDNWSPRVGVSVDPWGNRKSKVYANFGRYTENLPLDIAIRSLSNELDFPLTNWLPPNDGNGNVLVNPDGTLDFTNFGFANNNPRYLTGASVSGEAISPGTRSEYLDEYVVGFEHEFNAGVVFSARYVDRRIKRIIEDNAPLSPEAYQANLNQNYTISNVNKNQDLFVNVPQIPYVQVFDANGNPTLPHPTSCNPTGSNQSVIDAQALDSNGNVATLTNGNNAFCIPNAFDANNKQLVGIMGKDGIPDGFVDPNRVYKAVEFEVNKAMSKGWQMRANYRIAKLTGNYEGSFRNDNNQNDPNISSLFDFVQGNFNLLGQQFVPGVLNTDVRHLVNGFVSYTLSRKRATGLTLGSSVHFQTGTPISNLYAHPAYQNAGEIPFCADDTTNCPSARGSLGREKSFGSVDAHLDYPIKVTENSRFKIGIDLFNITNNKTLLRVDQFKQSRFGVGNADFLKPTGNGPSAVNGNTNPGYLRPFNARISVRYEF